MNFITLKCFFFQALFSVRRFNTLKYNIESIRIWESVFFYIEEQILGGKHVYKLKSFHQGNVFPFLLFYVFIELRDKHCLNISMSV